MRVQITGRYDVTKDRETFFVATSLTVAGGRLTSEGWNLQKLEREGLMREIANVPFLGSVRVSES